MNEVDLRKQDTAMGVRVGVAVQDVGGNRVAEPVLMEARNKAAECAARVNMAAIEVERISANLFGDRPETETGDDSKRSQRTGEVGALLDTVDALMDEVSRLESKVKRLADELQ